LQFLIAHGAHPKAEMPYGKLSEAIATPRFDDERNACLRPPECLYSTG
jgi:hypothetical protein